MIYNPSNKEKRGGEKPGTRGHSGDELDDSLGSIGSGTL